jgi:hypothetical protein
MSENWAYVANLGFRANSVFMFGGLQAHTATGGVFDVDEITPGWEVVRRGNRPTSAVGASCGGVFSGKPVIVGGRSDASLTDAVARYTPGTAQGGTESWDTRTVIPSVLAAAASATINIGGIDYLYVTGGCVSTGNTITNVGASIDTVRNYRDDTQAWALREPMGTVRKLHGCAASATLVYAMCGHTSSSLLTNYLTSIEAYTHGTDSWAPLTSDPGYGGRVGVGAAFNTGKIFVMGGQDLQAGPTMNPVGSTRIYDVATDTWSAGAEASRNRVFADAPVRGGQIVRASGQRAWDGPHIMQADLQSYSIADDAWTERGAFPDNNRNRRERTSLHV